MTINNRVTISSHLTITCHLCTTFPMIPPGSHLHTLLNHPHLLCSNLNLLHTLIWSATRTLVKNCMDYLPWVLFQTIAQYFTNGPRRDRWWNHVYPKDRPNTAHDKEPTPFLYILWSLKQHSCSLPCEDFPSTPGLLCLRSQKYCQDLFLLDSLLVAELLCFTFISSVSYPS